MPPTPSDPNPPPTNSGPQPSASSTARRPNPIGPGGWLVLGVLTLILVGIVLFPNTPSVAYSPTFEDLAAKGQIKKFTIIGKDRAEGEVRDLDSQVLKDLKVKLNGKQFSVNLPASDNQLMIVEMVKGADAAYRQEQKAKNPDVAIEPVIITKVEEPFPFLSQIILPLVMLTLFAVFFLFVLLPRMRDPMGGGGMASFIRSPARRYEKTGTKITFQDVAGMEPPKRELREVVEFLKTPEKYARLGAQVPKGVLLVGPPGTGKTLLAKAVAGEANVPFYNINGSEFIQMFVGVGASRVRDLFKTAKEHAPCVIFIDEIDAVGRMRGADPGGSGDERQQTLNQILSEMDGFSPSETVIVLAATNRPDVLDSALLRPGRFDRHVTVDRPTWQGRLAILKLHTRNKPITDDVDLERTARAMIGMSGAELRNLCNEAALIATREGKTVIDQKDFDAAADRVRLGLKREEKYGEEERKRTAYHEAGHVLCSMLQQPKANPLDRVSIIPRERTGGVAMFRPKDEDKIDHMESELAAELVVLMGGRAADLLVFGEPFSGASMDIKQATRIARAMVTQLGMSPRLGPVYFRHTEEHAYLGREMVEPRDFSEGTAKVIDEEIQRFVNDALAKAQELLKTHREDLDRIVEALLVHEELDREEVEQLLNGVPVRELRKTSPSAASAAPTPIPPALAEGEATRLSTGLAYDDA